MDSITLLLILKYIFLYIIFLALSLFTFYVPGYVALIKVRKDLEDPEVIALSLAISFVIFVTLAFLLAFLHLRVLMLPLLVLLNVYAFFKLKMDILSPWKIFSNDKILFFLIILGIFVLGIIDFPSGFKYQQGLLFWSSQGHDGIWHVSLIEEIKNTLPAKNPIFAGEDLYNYHYLVDVVMGEFNRIYPFFSSLDLYFRFMPVLLAFMIGMSSFAFVSRWQKSKVIGYWALFFTFFCGSFGYIVSFMHSGSFLGGETAFWAAQGNTILGNPPHAAAFVLLPSFLLCFFIYLKEKSRSWFFITLLIGSILAGFKVSGGIVMLLGVGAAAVIDFIKSKKFNSILLAGSLGAINYVTIKLMTRGAEGFLIFLPWWFVRTMVVSRLDWIDLEHKRQFYLAKGGVRATLRVIQFEALAFFIFLFGNMGMRVIGFVDVFKKYLFGFRKVILDPFDVGLFVTMWSGFVIPMFFVQKGIIYNNIQFLQYFDLIFGFFAALTTVKIINFLRNRIIKYLFIFVIILLSIPTVLGNFNEFYGPQSNPLSIISNQEIEALNYLKDNSKRDDVVLNLPFDKYLEGKFKNQPKPIFAWYSTGYISALTGRRTYLSSEEQVLITGYPIEERREKVKTFFAGIDFEANKQFLKENNIKYIYLPKKELQIDFNVEKNNLKKFFENNEVIIYTLNNET